MKSNRSFRACLVALALTFSVAFAPRATAASQGDSAIVEKVAGPCSGNGEAFLSADRAVGSQWRAYRVHIPAGGQVWSAIRDVVDPNGAVKYLAMHWLKPDGTLFAGAGLVGNSSGQTFKFRSGNAAVDVAPPLIYLPTGCTGVLAYGYPDPTPEGDYTGIFVQASKGLPVSTFELYGTPGVRVIRSTTGKEAFVHDIVDFKGDNNTLIVNGKAQKAIVKDGYVSEQIKHRLFANFSMDWFRPSPNTQMFYDGPTGAHQQFDIYSMIWNGAPGLYTFHLNTHGDPSPAVGGADVVLP